MAFTEQEKKIILYGKTNGKSQAEVEQALVRLRTGQGPKPKAEAEKPGIISRIGTDLKERVGNVKESYARQDAGQQNPIRTGLQIAGNVAGVVGDIGGEVAASAMEASGLTEPTGKVVNKVLETKPVQDLMNYYKSLPP